MRAVLIVLFFLLLSGCGGNSAMPQPTPAPTPAPVAIRELHVLVIGQSIASNCNQFVYGAVDNVFQIGRDGVAKAATDPFEWADCNRGSMWMPLGRRIVESGFARKVVFMPIGVGGTKVKDWQSGGVAFDKLNQAISQIKRNGIVFDMAIWHQGSSDIGTPRDEYTSRLLSVLAYVNSNVQIKRWLIGVHSRCWGNYDPEIEAAQRSIADGAVEGRYIGANTNLLGSEYRIDECHLNQQGQEKVANMWLEAIQNAFSKD